MDVTEHTADEYKAALIKMLPPGEYWTNQINDSESDISLILEARSEELATFRQRMNKLITESMSSTCEETIEDWERVYLDDTNEDLTIEQRRAALSSEQSGFSSIYSIAEDYGATLSVAFPLKVACCGHMRTGQSRLGSQAVLSVIYVQVVATSDLDTEGFEELINPRLLANYIPYYFYAYTDT